MYTIGITIVFCVLAGVQSQDTHDLHFESPPKPYVTEGETGVTLKCAVNQGALFLASQVLRVAHRSAKSFTVETISDQANLIPEYENMGFKLEFAYDPVCSVTLTFPAITADMDGEFLCQVKTSTDDEISEEVSGPVTVLAGVERVELTVENQLVESDTTLEFRAGQVSVGCVAFGSNPQPVVELMMDGKPVSGEMNAILDEGSAHPRRSYQGAVTAMLEFTHEMFGKQLSCKAGVDRPEGVTEDFPEVFSHTATLNGIVDEPTIECSNNTASMGDRRITLKCKVSKVPKVKKIYFNIGNQRQIYPGNKTDDLLECKINEFDSDNNEIVLQFYQMEDWHFTVNIYLEVVGFDDSQFQYPVYLIKENTSGAATVAASLLVLACSVLAMMSVLESS